MCLNDGRCNSSRAEAGVLADITGHGPALPVGGTHYHGQMESPSHYCTHQGSEIPLSYQAATHPHDHPPVGLPEWKGYIGYIPSLFSV
ncbi:hypothetical protein AVEN_67822-1 [Araneus ventricosus]|uniref:Uncharacterized protein n=1 Tax=Araneus ventricosus TaxID=182803 RepID=A0A4Y2TF25_ARAVE|nr:hypothetical protein AVEN_67822-1 [Araneus ventricosus]